VSEFDDALTKFIVKVDQNAKDVFADIVGKTHESIVDGSQITGALGQPVDTGNLRTSWNTQFTGDTEAVIQTNVEYAPYVEDNVNDVQFKNHGPHSVKQTIAAFERIVEQSVKDVVGAKS
jgi:hypothetical protein